MLIKKLSSALNRENLRRQVAMKRAFEIAMPAGGTVSKEHSFENSTYVRDVYQAFKQGDD